MTRLSTPQELAEYRQGLADGRSADRPCVSICAGAGCLASGASEVIAAFEEELATQGLDGGTARGSRRRIPGCHCRQHPAQDPAKWLDDEESKDYLEVAHSRDMQSVPEPLPHPSLV